MEFQPFPKVPRYSRNCVITEKLDGTNASIHIYRYEGGLSQLCACPESYCVDDQRGDKYVMVAASRKRFIGVGALLGEKNADNFGFAAWVYEHRHELVELGEGSHYGEWWGQGIQRGYGRNCKKFSLFNVNRWVDVHGTLNMEALDNKTREVAPECCHIVPVISYEPFSDAAVKLAMDFLKIHGSYAAPGFDDPEGIMIFHIAAQQLFKKTFENDAGGKG